MTNLLHRRRMSWTLVLWSGYVATWAAITGPGPAVVTLWWLLGMSVFGALWFVTQPLFQQWRRHEREELTLVVRDRDGQSLPEKP